VTVSFILSNIINVWLVLVPGKDALTRQQVIHNVLPAANAIMAPLNMKINRVKRLRKPMRTGNPAGVQLQNYAMYRLEAIKRRWTRRGRIVHFILPPMQYQGSKWFGGVASTTCYRDYPATSISNASLYRSNGKDALLFSAISMAHEVLHTLTARHDDDPTYAGSVMHSSALRWVDAGVSVWMTPATIRQVSGCQWR